jgi:ketosteroid isomerase-like protein
MPGENVELVRRHLDAWAEGSLPESDTLDRDVRWVNPPDALETGTHTGIEAFVAAGDAVRDAFGSVRIDFDRVVEDGDRVLVAGRLLGHGRGSGVQIERRQSYMWTIHGGRIVRFQWFNNPRSAFAAAGLPEPATRT